MLQNVCRHCLHLTVSGHVLISVQTALGKALAAARRQLVYGGGSKGIMGIVSGAVLDAGGDVVGVIPREMRSRWGEEEKVTGDGSTLFVELEEAGREMVRLFFFLTVFLLNRFPDGIGTDGCTQIYDPDVPSDCDLGGREHDA